MKKYIALEEKVLSVMNRNLAIAPGMEMFENSFTLAFPKFFKEVGTYTNPDHIAPAQLISEVAPVEELKEEILIDDSSDVKIVVETEEVKEEETPVEEVKPQVKPQVKSQPRRAKK